MSENHKKTYTADFLLLLISGGIPFGWQVSGYPPSIEVACVCWSITLLIFLHIVWTWTDKWKKQLRVIILILIPTVVIGFAGNPVKKQYVLQHNPPPLPKIEQNTTQWYLKIKRIEYIPTSADAPATAPAFKLLASVNGIGFGYPSEEMPYFIDVSSNGIEMTDSSPLPFSEKYEVRFDNATFRNNSLKLKSFNRTNMVTSGFGKADQFELKNLPASCTNEIGVSVVGKEESVGKLRIVYGISE
jgi:hypothetical protein